MIIFIRNIHPGTTRNELSNFVVTGLKGIFFNYGHVIKVGILVVSDQNRFSQTYQYHGLVQLDSEDACRMVINKLRGKTLKNRRVLVKEYVWRSVRNDRRKKTSTSAEIREKRVKDRRVGINRKNTPVMFSGEKLKLHRAKAK